MTWYDAVCHCIGAKEAYELIELAHCSRMIERGAKMGLTEPEVVSILAYTSNRNPLQTSVYELVNSVLRFPEYHLDEIERMRPLIAELESGLTKIPSYEGDVYRFTLLPDDVLAAAKVDQRFQDRGFVSSSTDPDLFNGRDFIFFRSRTGRPISDFSEHPGEMEVLFLPSSLFEVERMVKSAHGTILILNEVSNA